MALFGAPTVTADDARNAIAAAVEMQREMFHVNNDLRRIGFADIGIGIGLPYRRGNRRLHRFGAAIGIYRHRRHSESLTASRGEREGRAILVSDEARGAAGRVLYAQQAGPAIVVKNRHRPVQIFQMEWQRADTGGAARPDTNS